LGKRFGTKWDLYLSNPSPAEALRAINVNTGGALFRYLGSTGAKRYYKVALARKDNLLDKEELRNPSGRSDIYILPTVKGAKDGVGKVIAGAVLIVVGAVLSYYAPGNPFSSYLYKAGFALILGGVSQLLTPTPNFNTNSEGDSRGSNIFAGNAVAATQGAAVGLVYGRAMVTPMPISLSFSAKDQSAIADSFCTQEYETVDNGNGIIEYVPIPLDPSCNLPSDE
jgi:predicted phage tail protein